MSSYAIPNPRPSAVPDIVSTHPDITPATADVPTIPNGIYRLTGLGPLGRKGREVRVRTVRVVEMRDLRGDWSAIPAEAGDRLVERVAAGRASWVGPA